MNIFYLNRIFKNPKLIQYGIKKSAIYKKISQLTSESSIQDSSIFEKKTLSEYNKSRRFGYQKSICKAADSNMFFDMYGKVYLCCHNRKYEIGDVSKQSLAEIWNGDKIRSVRKTFLKNELPEGCSMCYFNIENGTYESAMSLNFDVFSSGNSKYPLRMDFEISNTCNLECIMCNGDFSNLIRKNREGRKPIAFRYDKYFLEQLDEFIPHLEFANFLGGEPQLIPMYYEIWNKLVKHQKAIIRVQTNASVLDNRFLDLVTGSKQFQISVSVDTLDVQLIPQIRKNIQPEIFLKNLETLSELHEKGIIDLSISVCPMIVNSKEIIRIIDFCNEKNIKISFNEVIFPYFNSLMSADLPLLIELSNFYLTYIDKLKISRIQEEIKSHNLNELHKLIQKIESYKVRRLELDKKYSENMKLTLEELKSILFKRTSENIPQIKIEEKSKDDIYNEIIGYIGDRNEDVQKHAILKMMEIPDEFNNILFFDERKDLYFHELKNQLKLILEQED